MDFDTWKSSCEWLEFPSNWKCGQQSWPEAIAWDEAVRDAQDARQAEAVKENVAIALQPYRELVKHLLIVREGVLEFAKDLRGRLVLTQSREAILAIDPIEAAERYADILGTVQSRRNPASDNGRSRSHKPRQYLLGKALVAHHRYFSGAVENWEPVDRKWLSSETNARQPSITELFQKWFENGYDGYIGQCLRRSPKLLEILSRLDSQS